MKSKITLTGERKIMNMQKLGIVVQSKSGQAKSANPRKQRAGGMTCYTLCEYQGQARRHSSRYGLAFDVTNLQRALPSGCNFSALGKIKNSSAVVTLSRSVPNWHRRIDMTNSLYLNQDNVSSGLTPAKTTVPPLPMGLRPVFYPSNPFNGFDVGTSPHGLSVNLREALRKLAGCSDRALSAKPVLGFGFGGAL